MLRNKAKSAAQHIKLVMLNDCSTSDDDTFTSLVHLLTLQCFSLRFFSMEQNLKKSVVNVACHFFLISCQPNFKFSLLLYPRFFNSGNPTQWTTDT